MDDIVVSLYGSHNDAATQGIFSAAEKIASEYGDDAVEMYEQWLDQIPAEEVFDFEDAEKTASELDEGILEKVAEADFLGRVMFHAFQAEAAKHEKMAEYVGDRLFEAFVEAHSESR